MVAEIFLGRSDPKWPGDEGEKHYWFNLKGDNGEIIATSEQYTQKHNVTEVLNKYFHNMVYIKDRTGE